jgi:hypothetical protein
MKEKQIPTARDFAINIDIYFDSEEEHVELANKLIEFAKLYVTEALKAKINALQPFIEEGGWGVDELDAFIKNAYPLDKIQ